MFVVDAVACESTSVQKKNFTTSAVVVLLGVWQFTPVTRNYWLDHIIKPKIDANAETLLRCNWGDGACVEAVGIRIKQVNQEMQHPLWWVNRW